MKELLSKIFKEKLGLGRVVISAFGFILGLTLVLVSIQVYVGIRSFLFPEEKQADYIILNKEVGIGHTLFGSKVSFKDEEFSDLKSQPFVEDIAAFVPNQFAVRAHAGGSMGLLTDLFFEALPKHFIDDVPSAFRWRDGSDVVPIIVSREFLKLYNFGFAVGKNKPQISESTIQMLPLDVEIYGSGGRKKFKAKVVGFSDRIPSFLVPEAFMDWANKNIAGETTKPKASRIIVKIKAEQAGLVNDYLKKNDLSLSEDKIKYSKILSVLNVTMSVIIFIGLAFISFALLIIILNFTLLIAETKQEISLLIQLGYKRNLVLHHLFLYLLLFMLIVTVLSILFLVGGTYFAGTFLSGTGIYIPIMPQPVVLLTIIGVVACSVIVSYYSLRRVICQNN